MECVITEHEWDHGLATQYTQNMKSVQFAFGVTCTVSGFVVCTVKNFGLCTEFHMDGQMTTTTRNYLLIISVCIVLD